MQHERVIRDFSNCTTGAVLRALFLTAIAGCSRAGGAAPDSAVSEATSSASESSARTRCEAQTGLASLDAAKVSLAQTYARRFKLGVAINGSVYGDRDPAAAALVAAQFNRVTAGE